MSKAPLGRSLLLTAVVALGIAAGWAFVVVMIGSSVQAQQANRHNRTYESLYVRLDGEPVIARWGSVRVASAKTTAFTLDGQPAEAYAAHLLSPTYLSPRPLGHPDWNGRLTGVSDHGTPEVFWYLVHDGRPNGRAYGVGYHSLTKRAIGYFGPQGFTDSLPPRDERFVIAGDHGLSGATPTLYAYEPSANWVALGTTLPLLANGKLWLIDVQKRQVEPLVEAPAATAVGQAWVTLESLPAVPEEQLAFVANPAVQKLLVRSPDSLMLVDPRSGDHKAFPLPESLRKSTLGAFELAGGDLLVVAYDTAIMPNDYRLLWIDPSGKVLRERTARVAPSGYAMTLTEGMWLMVLATPLLLSGVVAAFVAPFSMVKSGNADSYAAALGQFVGEAWLPLLALVAISLVAAAAAYRRHQRFGLPHPLAWAALVFVLGVPGWIAYRLHRTWPVLEACPACDESTPRDRELCTECGAAFPPPAAKGIEVFA